jgi:hypothetical protein
VKGAFLKHARRVKRRQKKRYPNSVGVARSEKGLVSIVMAALGRTQKPGNRVVVSSEFDCFQGVADVVLGVYNGYRLFPNAAKSKLSLVSFSTARVLSALVRKRIVATMQYWALVPYT